MTDPQRPFSHQQEAFDVVVNQRKSLYMIAGTAAGKTLAVGLPLFHLLKNKEIKRVLFMYPTLALLDDQRRVMEKLARITHLQVGEIKGGMTRAELITALNCPVILATPDAIYWFFRKNVKFKSLLIYGLAKIDAFVLDEAHLFSGLSLRSLTLLKERILVLAQQLGKYPHWHILTATPHEDLRALTTDGVEIHGKSKCGAVGLELLEPRDNLANGRSQMIATVNKVLEQGANKVLLVFNSAAVAHDTFHRYGKGIPEFSEELKRKYGRVWLSSLRKWMIEEGISEDASHQASNSFPTHTTVCLQDLDKNGSVKLKSEELMAVLTNLLEAQIQTIVSSLQNENEKLRDKLAKKLWEAVLLNQNDEKTVSQARLQQWLSERMVQLEEVWQISEIVVNTPNAFRLQDDLEEAGFPSELSKEIHQRLLHTVKLSSWQLKQWGHLPKTMRSRQVMLSWAVKQVADPEEQTYFQEMLTDPIAFDRLQVNFPNVGLWADSNVPVILYSGKMTKAERDGQIRLFDELERAVLVSTSAVEVGVDFDADVLITEQCPGPDLLQRFGRIGRREGVQGRVILQVHEQQAFFKLRQKLQEFPTLSREVFSGVVTELFPPRRYLSGSVFLDATHWLINDQLGRIGNVLNEAMFSLEIAQLAMEIRRAGLPFAFGLRGTMPQVGLRDGVTLSPFYALRKINNTQLWPSESPFELTQANMTYTQFIYEPAEWNLIIDWQNTLQDSQALFYELNGHWHLQTGRGIAEDYFRAYGRMRKILHLLDNEQEQYEQLIAKQPQHPLIRLGLSLQQLRTEKRGLVLGFGNVYLKREDFHNKPHPIEDIFNTALKLADQTWLFILGNELEIKRNLERLGFSDTEELMQIKCDDKGVILVETMVGAVFQVYNNWRETHFSTL